MSETETKYASAAVIAEQNDELLPMSVAERDARAAAAAHAALNAEQLALDAHAHDLADRRAAIVEREKPRSERDICRAAAIATLAMLDSLADHSISAQPLRRMLEANAALFSAMAGEYDVEKS